MRNSTTWIARNPAGGIWLTKSPNGISNLPAVPPRWLRCCGTVAPEHAHQDEHHSEKRDGMRVRPAVMVRRSRGGKRGDRGFDERDPEQHDPDEPESREGHPPAIAAVDLRCADPA